jgi:hypothetical protein
VAAREVRFAAVLGAAYAQKAMFRIPRQREWTAAGSQYWLRKYRHVKGCAMQRMILRIMMAGAVAVPAIVYSAPGLAWSEGNCRMACALFIGRERAPACIERVPCSKYSGQPDVGAAEVRRRVARVKAEKKNPSANSVFVNCARRTGAPARLVLLRAAGAGDRRLRRRRKPKAPVAKTRHSHVPQSLKASRLTLRPPHESLKISMRCLPTDKGRGWPGGPARVS